MEVRGKLVACDRCGKKIFLKYLGKGEADGGYTTWDKFEAKPETWMNFTEFGTLCNECGGVFRNFINIFLSGKSVAPTWSLKDGDEHYRSGISVPPVYSVVEEYIEQS